MPQQQGDSFWNWLGRQVGHVKKAVKTDVTKPAAPAVLPDEAQTVREPTSEAPDGQIVYRDAKAEEVELPDQPGVKLRRTIIDEVIVDETKQDKKGDSSQ